MTASIPRIPDPELFIGFVSPIGADLLPVVAAFRACFARFGYRVQEVQVTDVFRRLTGYFPPDEPLVDAPLRERFQSHIGYGNQIRRIFNDDSILAGLTVARLVGRRVADGTPDRFSRTVYLLHQFKRQEEIELLRSVYGPLFFQVSVYSRRGARVADLARRFAESEHEAQAQPFRDRAEAIIQRDEDERDIAHGQRVGRIFHNADLIVSLDSQPHDMARQVERFCELLFSSNRISPTRLEYGMFAAKAAALRTLDLSRQVGAAIFSPTDDVIALGCNEVPKAGGGQYWPDDPRDDREFVRGYDSNDRRKQQILAELAKLIGPDRPIEEVLQDGRIRDSQFMDALEYGRIVHAEMAAITDAARLGRSLSGSTLYCTTFPCHMCAKHIIAAGIARVIFLEPYPKSLAASLHGDSLQVEQGERGQYDTYPAVRFEHFHGITPRRYRELFERTRRKSPTGEFQHFPDGRPQVFLDIKAPFYAQLEGMILERLSGLPEDIVRDPS